MTNLSFNVQNIAEGNGWNISIVGMSIVFLGLICISLYITGLPRILAIIHQTFGPEDVKMAKPKPPRPVSLNASEIQAVAFVIEAENQRLEMGNLRVTIAAQGDVRSPWSLSNKMRTFPTRTAS